MFPPVPHLLGHHTVDILGDTAGHQVDGGGTNQVPAQGCVVLQAIAGAVLHGGAEQGRHKCQHIARAQLVDLMGTLGSKGYCRFCPLSLDSLAAGVPAVASAIPVSIVLSGSYH